MDERVMQAIAKLPEDIREKAQAATSREELQAIVDSYDGFIELSEEELQWLSGGCSTEVYGDVRENFDSSRIAQSFIMGEDLGF